MDVKLILLINNPKLRVKYGIYGRKLVKEKFEITSLKRKNLRQWRSKCAMIFQQFNLIDRLDVLTNVLSGTLGINFNLLKLFKIYSKKEKLEALTYLHNLDLSSKALQRVGTLSGGQQQRVAVARALITEPDLILADEPTGALDSTTSKEVMALIQRINNEGKTILVVTHEHDIANMCKRIVHLRDGIIVEDKKIKQNI